MIPGSKSDHPSLIKSFLFAIQGFRFAVKSERNLKIMVVAFFLAIIAAAFLRCTAIEWAFILIASGVVFASELLNTSIETIVDLVSPEYHTLAGKAKDVAAAAVYVLSFLVGIAGCVIFIQAFLRLL